VGPAHTLGDLIVYVPDAGVVMAGDILFIGSTPVLWDGSARNWTRACERILQLKPAMVVPGHGPLTDLAGVDMVRHYWQFLRSAVRRHFEKGRPAFESALRIATSDDFLKQPFAAWDFRERIVINVNAIYRRLMGRSRRIGALDRLRLLRQTALMERELLRHGRGAASDSA
jgi:glyoxylase-like metal-dependent hydrolase (beta-lactamase superfamily II)